MTQHLVTDLSEIVGASHVLTGQDAAPWACDWTGQYVGEPKAVVRPATTEEVSALLRYAETHDLAVVPVAGNTGLNGGTLAQDALVLSLARLNRIRSIRPDARVAEVDAGVIVDALDTAAEAHGLCFPLAFGASGSAMIGGVLSTNAGGANVLRYGNARDLCLGVEVVLADGRVMNLMSALPKNNSGFDLRNLVIGAEGQLGIITGAVMKLFPRPQAHWTAMVALEDLRAAPALLHAMQDATDNAVVAFEFMSRSYIEGHLDLDPKAREPFVAPYPANILIELAQSRDEINEDIPLAVLAEAMEKGIVLDAIPARNEAQRAEFWTRREAAAEISFRKSPVLDTDIAVPLDRVADWLSEIEPRLAAVDPECETLSVAHLGDGNIHYSVYPSRDDSALKAALRAQIDGLAQEMDGTFSAEHGVGLSKLAPMAKYKDPVALDVMRRIKQALDPKNTLNPGKTLPMAPL